MAVKPTEYNIEIYRGDTMSLTVVYGDDSTGSPVPFDLTGCDINAEIREKADTETVTAIFLIDTGDQAVTPGRIDLYLDSTNSELLVGRRYVWDLEVEFPDGRVRTPVAGNIVATPDVTRDIL